MGEPALTYAAGDIPVVFYFLGTKVLADFAVTVRAIVEELSNGRTAVPGGAKARGITMSIIEGGFYIFVGTIN